MQVPALQGTSPYYVFLKQLQIVSSPSSSPLAPSLMFLCPPVSPQSADLEHNPPSWTKQSHLKILEFYNRELHFCHLHDLPVGLPAQATCRLWRHHTAAAAPSLKEVHVEETFLLTAKNIRFPHLSALGQFSGRLLWSPTARRDTAWRCSPADNGNIFI